MNKFSALWGALFLVYEAAATCAEIASPESPPGVVHVEDTSLCFEAGCVWGESEENPIWGECLEQTCGVNMYWKIDYVGKSTQFKFFNPCEDDTFIKVKMDDLTEYDSSNKKTNNKETAFASASWNAEPVYGTYEGNDALINTYVATLGKSAGNAGFSLESIFFVDVDDASQNSLKFSANISGWTMDADDHYLVLCVAIMTNGNGSVEVDGDTDTYSINGFEIQNDATAKCNDAEINVGISEGGNGNNHLDLCYTFESCVGDIFYDPLVTHVETSDDVTGDDTDTDTETNGGNTDTDTDTSAGDNIVDQNGANSFFNFSFACFIFILMFGLYF